MTINVTKSFLPPLRDYVAYLEKIWATAWVTNHGPLVKELEQRLTETLSVPYLQYVTNGTTALQLALKVLGVRGEVITTPYSYVATTTAIMWEKCQPVFVDIHPQTLCIDPDLIEHSITERTEAILATHVYGYPCDVERIAEIAARHGLKVIYDAAHAFGVRVNGDSILNHGDLSTLSFHATKLFHTVEGGAVVSNDPAIHEALGLLKSFGHRGDLYLSEGINGKNSELHAAMGLCNLAHIPDILAARKRIFAWYDELLLGLPLVIPQKRPDVEYNYAYYAVIFDTPALRERAQSVLESEGIAARRYFWPSLTRLPYVNAPYCEVAEAVAERVLCLPLHSEIPHATVQRIAGLVRTACSMGAARIR